MMMLGLRGTGKTVLLGKIREIGVQAGHLVSQIEAPEGDSLAKMLLPEMRKVMRSLSVVDAAKQQTARGLRALRNFASVFKLELAGVNVGVEPEPEPGLADSGDLQFDLPDLFEVIGNAAKSAQKGWLLLIDEVQYLSEKDLSALIVSMHKMSQQGLPVLFIGAGLPQVAKLAGNAKSYAERLFVYPEIGALCPVEAAIAIQKPVQDENAEIAPEALDMIVSRTQGYPFFLQEWGAHAWDIAEGNRINEADAESSYNTAIASLDDGFFKVRIDRLTKAESAFVGAMSELGNGPYALSDVATSMGKTISALGPARANIIKKGMIYSTGYGYIDFTVPLFGEFMRRQAER